MEVLGKKFIGYGRADGTHWYWDDKQIAVINERGDIEWCERLYNIPSDVVEAVRARVPRADGTWLIEARRTSISATQGSICIYVNGKDMDMCFNDEKVLVDGKYVSTTPDNELGKFVYACLWHKYDNLYHYSDRFKDVFKPNWRGGEELKARFKNVSLEEDELDFYTDLIEEGYTVPVVRKYMGDAVADHMLEFCANHGLAGEEVVFDEILDTFENEDIKELAVRMISDFPDYFYKVGASSTCKYHPKFAEGRYGLARHTIAVVRILNYMLGLEQNKKQFTARERDLLRLAGIMHDSRKYGKEEAEAYTVFAHPLLAGGAVRKYIGAVPTVTIDEIGIVARACETHTGEWTKDKYSDTVLPKPADKYDEMLHLADYLASRKDIEMIFDDFAERSV